LKECGIEKSKQKNQLALDIMEKLGVKFSVFVSTFHSTRFTIGEAWTMPSFSKFIVDFTQERDKLIHMDIIKHSNAHALVVHDGSNSQNPNPKGREMKRHMQIQRRKGTPNHSMIPLVPKVEK
jgi:hypothetical protein